MNEKIQIRIFVEGDEAKFINDYLNYLYSNNIPKIFDIINIGGWTKIPLNKNKFEYISDINGKNLVIFDADNDVITRRLELEKFKEKCKITFETFLFPNNSENGNFENLLEQIINQKHKCVFECFENYETCLSKKGTYTLPNRKAKIFAYLEALNEETKPKLRNYNNQHCWNFDSSKLTSLKNFLKSYFDDKRE